MCGFLQLASSRVTEKCSDHQSCLCVLMLPIVLSWRSIMAFVTAFFIFDSA